MPGPFSPSTPQTRNFALSHDLHKWMTLAYNHIIILLYILLQIDFQQSLILILLLLPKFCLFQM